MQELEARQRRRALIDLGADVEMGITRRLADIDHPTEGPERVEALLQYLGAERVDDKVDTAALGKAHGFSYEILSRTVDDMVGAEGQR
jgi:hypothetical protein